MENPEKPKMKVTDRRQFTRKGERRTPPPTEEADRGVKAPAEPRVAASTASGTQPKSSIEFQTLVLSLTRQALMLLGEEPDPQGNVIKPQLEAARNVVDMLMSLRDKTQGNLTAEEESLLQQVVYELQMKFSQKK